DEKHGGFIGRIDGNNRIDEKADKGAILNSRILWTFSAAYNYFKDPAYLANADRAFSYLIDHFIDNEHGGVFWMLDYKGNPTETKKQIYTQAFAIYGFSAYYKASRNKHALNAAIELFKLIETYAFDHGENGYFEAFDRQWNLLQDLRLSEKDANEKKTLNTHLHILEAYTTLYQIWKNKKLKKQLKNLIELKLDKFVNENSRFQLFFDENWNPKSDLISFGHDIEGSWLLLEAAKVLGDEQLIAKTKKVAISMVNSVMESGIDNDGGLIYEVYSGVIKDTDKHWWPQAEAIVGFVNAWQISSDSKYLKKAKMVWEFTKDKIIDWKDGEWWFRVNKVGQPYLQEDKAGPWKCPYHNGRACLEI
ncbi:MAG: AGE family epimerase/isomerase, partial [Cyclobacteriaceae bacterium]|nr:AGE family epimerase/isomerase [Cyclobacteriaceae bacterium]